MASVIAGAVRMPGMDSEHDKLLQTLDAVIAAAGDSVRDDLPESWRGMVGSRTDAFNHVATPASLNIFLFHQSVSADTKAISTVDIKGLDHSQFDYDLLINRNVSIALWSNPGSRVILVTDDQFLPKGITDPRVSIVRLPLAVGEPMFERVVSMLSYVESNAFLAPTIFLDSDAFLLRYCAGFFLSQFDIGVTYRDIGGQMPINEGVIFANTLDRDAVRRFFRRYLATYLQLEGHPVVRETYGNVRRWRGGQLSINAASGGLARYAAGVSRMATGGRLACLPCSRYNFSPDSEHEIGPAMLARALILHLKGNRKPWLDRMVEVLALNGYRELIRS
jgi:hypothetical protein